MKKSMTIFSALLCCLLPLLTACSGAKTVFENRNYSVTEKDGRFYLEFKNSTDPGSLPANGMMLRVDPTFSSLDEMKRAIREGDFTESELRTMRMFFPSEDGKIEICDVENLYDVKLPADVELDYITWTGLNYSFEFRNDTIIGGINYCTADTFEENYKREYTDYFDRDQIHLTSQATDPERDATVYYYTTSTAELKTVRYTISDGSKTIYVQEEYNLRIRDNMLPTSESVPYNIDFWGIDNGVCFYGVILGFTERPSVEWLSSFGLEPYTSGSTE